MTDTKPPAAPPSADRDAFEARDNARAAWVLFALVFGGMALLWSVFAWGMASRAENEAHKALNSGGSGGSSVSASGPVMVHLKEFSIDPQTIQAPVNGTLTVMNIGTTQHNLAIQGQNKQTPMINPGGQATLSLAGLSPGNYTVYCQVPGHEALGMKATLTIASSSQAASGGMDMGTSATATGTGLTAEMIADGMTMSPAAMDAAMKATTTAFPAKTAGVGGQPLAPTILPDGTKQFDLTAKVVDWQVSPTKTVKAWTYNGTVPGPTIRVNVGDKVQVVLHNQLPEATTIHFHGIVGPQNTDGTPYVSQDPVQPGQDYTYTFVAKGPAIGMYHSHFDATLQVESGMAGAFYIGDMPIPASVTAQGVQPSQIKQYEMFLNDSGNIGLSLNGKSFPATAPIVANVGDWFQMTYFNEGQLMHPMHLHEEAQMIIARDGFPLTNPEMDDTVVVAPGQRITVLVHAVDKGTWVWHCHILQHAEGPQGMFGMVTALVVQ